ncbi:ferredoxin [Rhodococcus sp. B50]|uniref:ferredoxin n=1 Tax=Rhodococcus sp. B50 TaxID=2682847 RepID=UPI0019DD9A60|nr:ferredoxin [Rhodococcus sp. B50]MBS9376007.1 Ferredoxin [Rhodococcus sp. B50]
MKISLDATKCTGLGICEAIAPEVFEVDDQGDLVLLTDIVPEGMLATIEEAVEGCPTRALRIVP